MSETALSTPETDDGNIELLIDSLRDEFRRAYEQDRANLSSPLPDSPAGGDYYRWTAEPMHGREYTMRSVIIVRKPPHPNDDPYNFTEIYAPIPEEERNDSWVDNPPGVSSSLFYLHIRRMKGGLQNDTWVQVDKTGVYELETDTYEPVPKAIDVSHATHCAEKLIGLMRRENLVAATTSEVPYSYN